MNLIKTRRQMLELAQERLGQALAEDVLALAAGAKGDRAVLERVLRDVNGLLREVRAGVGAEVTTDLLKAPAMLESQLRASLDSPVQRLGKVIPNRLDDWAARDVPPEGTPRRRSWASEGRLLLTQARIEGGNGPYEPVKDDPFVPWSLEWAPTALRRCRALVGWVFRFERKRVIAVALLLTALTGLFPPWVCVDEMNGNRERNARGFGCLSSPPGPGFSSNSPQIELSRLLIEWACIWAFAGALFILGRPSGPPGTQARAKTGGTSARLGKAEEESSDGRDAGVGPQTKQEHPMEPKPNQQAQARVEETQEPRDDPWWELALDHLEEQWPESLERLLRAGALKEHLDKLVEAALSQAAREREAGADEVEAAAAVNDLLCPENPDYDPQNPPSLTPQGEQELRRFRSRWLR